MIQTQPVPPWPEALRAYLECGRKQIPFEIYPRSLGIGIDPARPYTEYRQLDLQINHGDWKGVRYIAIGVPLRARTDDPYLWVIPYDGGEIVLAVVETRVRFQDWPVFDQVVFRNDEPPDEARRTAPGRKLTKTQAKKLDQAQQLLDALPQGRFTLRGRPHEKRDAARERLLTAALELLKDHFIIDREALASWTRGVTSEDGVADLLARAGWGLQIRGAKPYLPHIAAEVHRIRRHVGVPIAEIVSMARQVNWNLAHLQESANKTHILRAKAP